MSIVSSHTRRILSRIALNHFHAHRIELDRPLQPLRLGLDQKRIEFYRGKEFT
jgi:hypothetical protein